MALYENEFVRYIRGYQSLFYFLQPTKKVEGKNKSLVLFWKGGPGLARVSYGIKGLDKKNFLAHWFVENGHPFLGVSSPIAHEVFDKVYPEFDCNDGATQVITAARDMMEQYNLGKKVIILLWGWGGLLLDDLVRLSHDLGVNIDFFVMMDATPKTPYHTQPFIPYMSRNNQGLCNVDSRFSWFDISSQIDEIIRANKGMFFISKDEFIKETIGSFPVGVTGVIYKSVGDKNYFQEGVVDSTFFSESDCVYPDIFVLNDNSRLGIRNSIATCAYWGMLLDKQIIRGILEPNKEKLKDLPKNKQDYIFKEIESYKKKAFHYVDGAHNFFMGEYGAKISCNLILQFIEDRKSFKKAINEILL